MRKTIMTPPPTHTHIKKPFRAMIISHDDDNNDNDDDDDRI